MFIRLENDTVVETSYVKYSEDFIDAPPNFGLGWIRIDGIGIVPPCPVDGYVWDGKTFDWIDPNAEVVTDVEGS